jgi:hypothetical protein
MANDKKKSNRRQIAFRVTKTEEIYLMRKCKERNERISTVMRRALWQYCGMVHAELLLKAHDVAANALNKAFNIVHDEGMNDSYVADIGEWNM